MAGGTAVGVESPGGAHGPARVGFKAIPAPIHSVVRILLADPPPSTP